MAHCASVGYGDYDHAAFWFGLEPVALEFARTADVLFLGNSRMQVGFSAATLTDWFSALPARHYLLGFVYENYIFEEKLLRKLTPHARAYVISLDYFFQQSESVAAKTVMYDPGARGRNQRKRLWQLVHRPVCEILSAICGDQYVVFRSRSTGVWFADGGDLPGAAVSEEEGRDERAVTDEPVSARGFLSRLSVPPECVILTIVPTVGTRRATANGIADAIGMNLVAPKLNGLHTFDGSHLDRPSAERWSRAFVEAAGPRIRNCLNRPSGKSS
jgi:hypothetical protein